MMFVAIIVFNFFYESFSGVEGRASLEGLGAMMAAMFTGHYYHKYNDKILSNSERWIYASYFTTIHVVIALILIPSIALILPELKLSGPIILLTIGITAVASLIGNRIGFGWGLNDAEKVAATAK